MERAPSPFQNTQPGQVIGPIPLASGLLVVQLVSKEETRATFEQLPPGLQENLRNEGVRFAHERRLAQVTERLKREYPVEIDPIALRKASWPPEPPQILGAANGAQLP